MQKPHMIYVPGFGDSYDIIRKPLFYCWRVFGVSTTFVPMNWQSNETYLDKLARITEAIDNAPSDKVILIGESAGASMVVAAHAKKYTALHKSVTICGKVNNAASVADRYYRRNAAFREAIHEADTAITTLPQLARQKFISFYPLYDEVVSLKDATLPGAGATRLFSVGHLLTIFLALTLFSGLIIKAARKND